MKNTLLRLALAGTLGLGLAGCTQEQKAKEAADRVERCLEGDTKPFLDQIYGETRFEAVYCVDNYPEKGTTTKFFDAGRKGGSYGDGSLDYVGIYKGEAVYIGRKDKGFEQFEQIFETQVKPVAKKIRRLMSE